MARYSKRPPWTDKLCDSCLAAYESSDDAVELCPRCEARISKWLKDTYGADEDIEMGDLIDPAKGCDLKDEDD